MGLTIHYTLHCADIEASAAQELVSLLRESALELSYDRVGALTELHGDACSHRQYENTDKHKWLSLKGRRLITESDRFILIEPAHMIAFDSEPGAGCEWASFGLARYPESIKIRDQSDVVETISTHLTGWHWRSFCKTQYASNPADGGLDNFMKCHLSVIGVLDRARDLGILHSVSDEGGYWDHRDPKRLARDVGRWNRTIARVYGTIKDQLKGEGYAPIGEYPDFEHLEAEGHRELDEKDGPSA